jgi:hypothetical protein
MNDIKGIGYQDIVQHLSKIAPSYQEELVLIGGQALFFWADYYNLSEEQIETPLMSKDIDFLGSYNAAAHCAKVWKGKLYQPSSNDHTPNTAKVIIPLDNQEQIDVDFLAYVHGLDKNEANKKASFQAQEEKIVFYVLNPVFCLKSRLENIYGLGYGKNRILQEVSRLKMAIMIERLHLNDLLNNKDTRRAINETKLLLTWAKNNKGINVYLEHHVDILESIPYQHEGYGNQFWEKFYPSQEQHI